MTVRISSNSIDSDGSGIVSMVSTRIEVDIGKGETDMAWTCQGFGRRGQ